MDYNGEELKTIRKEIEQLIKELENYPNSEKIDTTDFDEESSIILRYKKVMDYLVSQNTLFLKSTYIELVDKFFSVLEKKKRLLEHFKKYINGYINELENNISDNINYFISFKSTILVSLYWKIDGGLYSDISNLKKQLNILKFCINIKSQKLLFNMFQGYYNYQEFNSFSDYSECIKDTVITLYMTDEQYTESVLEKLSMSISYAGVAGSIGYDFNGINTIKNVFGLVNHPELIEEIVSRLASKVAYRGQMTVDQINAVINTSNIKPELKNKLKFIYTTVQILDGAFKRAVLKSIPREYEIDGVDDFEYMNGVSLPKILSINNGDHIFTLHGYEEGLDEKNVYLDDKILFSINDKGENQFEIHWGEERKLFNYENNYELRTYLEEKLRDEFKNVVSEKSSEIKLIYFWFEKHKILENVSLKFSDKYKVEYFNEKWTIFENPNELESVLYSNSDEKVSMINAIVGKNGSGKTTLLDAFKYYFNNQSDAEVFGNFFVLYEDGENLILRHNFKQKEPILEVKCSKRFRVLRLDTNSDIFANTNILSYTSFLGFSNYLGSEHDRETEGNHRDLSIFNDYKILERVKDANEREGIKRQLVNTDNYKKLTLLSESKTYNTVFTENIPLPHEVLLNIEVKSKGGSEKTCMDKIDNNLVSFFKERIIEKRKNTLISDKKRVARTIPFDITYKIKIDGIDDFHYLYKFVKKDLGECKMICTLDFLGLSSGEYAKLTLFSRLFFESDHAKVKGIKKALTISNAYVKDYIHKDGFTQYVSYPKNENLMILLDEGDMFFHPEWQKGFINDIKVLLNNAFKDHKVVKTIHILVTSNSPFIMSDIPIEHTIVLGEECCKEQTYAQNIHDILKSSFFMHTGTIGNVAQKHIKKLISLLSKVKVAEKDRQYIKKSINMIGEPMIRYRLESMYKKKFSGEISKEERIKQLEEELTRLKGQGVEYR